MSKHIEDMVTAAAHEIVGGGKSKEAQPSMNFADGMILPHGQVRQVWDFAVVFVLLYVVMSEPVFLGFNIDLASPFNVIDPIVLSFFALDLVVNFRTAYEDKHSQMITGWKPVAVNYLKSANCRQSAPACSYTWS